MESNELLASLAKMEATLNEVESARKQVESTVNASYELQKEVREYVSAVKALCASLQSWESDLRAREEALSREYEEAIRQVRSTCTEVIRLFESDVEKTSTDFKAKTDSVIVKFTEQNDKLTESVKELVALREQIKKATEEIESVKSALNVILKELKDSQDEQDEALNDIKNKISTLSTKTEEIISISKNLISNIDSLKALCQETNRSINSSTTHIITSLDDLKANEQTHFDSIVKRMENQEKRINTEFDVVRRQNKVFSIIIIILLLLIAGLVFFY